MTCFPWTLAAHPRCSKHPVNLTKQPNLNVAAHQIRIQYPSCQGSSMEQDRHMDSHEDTCAVFVMWYPCEQHHWWFASVCWQFISIHWHHTVIRNHLHFVLVGIKRAAEGCSFCNTDWWALHSLTEGLCTLHKCFAVVKQGRVACSLNAFPEPRPLYAKQRISSIRLMAWWPEEQQCKTVWGMIRPLRGLQMVGPTPIL